MSKSHPARFAEQDEAEQARVTSVKPLLRYFIAQYNGIVEERLQKLCFYTEAVHYEEHGSRLSNVDYRPFMYGMFSDDIRTGTEQLDADGGEVSKTLRNGKVVDLFETPDTPAELDDDLRAFLDAVHEETRDRTTSEIAQWTKDHRLFSLTPYDDAVVFSKLDTYTE